MTAWEAVVLIFVINIFCGNPIADWLQAIRGITEVTNNYSCDCSCRNCGGRDDQKVL